jgi:hypothetical protein
MSDQSDNDVPIEPQQVLLGYNPETGQPVYGFPGEAAAIDPPLSPYPPEDRDGLDPPFRRLQDPPE